MEVIALSVALVIVVLAFARVLALYLRLRAVGPRTEIRERVITKEVPKYIEVPKEVTKYVEVPKEVIKEVTKYVEVPKQVTKYVEVPKEAPKYVDRGEPDALIAGADDFTDPTALPEVPDAVTDSVADGARYSSVTVRAASTRGEASRKEGRLRRQTVAVAVLRQFNPPVLLSVVAAGQPGTRAAQVGAAQACRSVQHKVSDAAAGIQGAWPAGGDHDQRLAECLRGVLRAIGRPLTDAALSRGLDPREVATELTCVLTRLGDPRSGDGARRAHLAFGVGAGQVLVQRLDAAPRNVLGPAGGGQPATVPAAPDAVRWARFETTPGDLVVACTASTVPLLGRDEFRKSVTAEWLTAAPALSRFLAQLNFADQFCTEDRTAAVLWEVKPR
jgi:hypothetical protein